MATRTRPEQRSTAALSPQVLAVRHQLIQLTHCDEEVGERHGRLQDFSGAQ